MFTHTYSEYHSKTQAYAVLLQSSTEVYEVHCFDPPHNSKQVRWHAAVFYRTNQHCSLLKCCQAIEEGMISTLVGWDTAALRTLNISSFEILI